MTFRPKLALGLADDDREFHVAVEEASGFLPAPSLRSFFVSLLVGEAHTPAPALWEEFGHHFAEDFISRGVPPEEAKKRALIIISRLLSLHGRFLADFGLPDVVDPESELGRERNRFSDEECSSFVNKWKPLLTAEQRGVINEILSRFPQRLAVSWPQDGESAGSPSSEEAPSAGTHETLALLAAGGCGKTEVLKFLAHHLRLHGEVVICSAFTGIAATNLPGGVTAHSSFRLPFDSTDPDSTCTLSMSSQRAELLRQASLIIFDEVAMLPRNTFRAFQRLLTDLHSPCLRVVLLCGDFAQIPPVVKYGTKKDVLRASVKFCPEWLRFPVLRLTRNMRASEDGEYAELTRKVGQGELEEQKIA
jgi:hypothetical protein